MRRELEHIEIPAEHEARERTWRLVASAFEDRAPSPPRRAGRIVPALVLVVIGAIVAAALSPPGRAVFHAIRERVGVEKSQPALFSVPAGGRLLVTSDAGVWVVQADGSKRRLGSYREASWSPHGLYVAATRRNALYALTPTGDERWSLGRPDVRLPRWTGSRTDTRIAYTSGDQLHVVGGDGRGDESLSSAPDMSLAPRAWRPQTRRRVLAVALPAQGMLLVVDVDAHGEELWSRRVGQVSKLEWSSDGRRLLVLGPRHLRVYTASGTTVQALGRTSAVNVDAAFRPGTHDLTLVRRPGEVSQVVLAGRVVFSTAGELRGLTWSPDGRWLLVSAPEADQWVFVRADGRKIAAVSDISAQFRSQSLPRVEGWAP
jgi:hypothetical protein